MFPAWAFEKVAVAVQFIALLPVTVDVFYATIAQFFTSMRKGKLKGLETSRDLLPPMPWQSFKNVSDDDLRAIFAYLKSTKPIENVVPAPKAPTQL